MEATAFDEENAVIDPPKGRDDCASLSVFLGKASDGTPCVISCWKLTKEELEQVVVTGRVWLVVMGETMPPVALEGLSPFQMRK